MDVSRHRIIVVALRSSGYRLAQADIGVAVFLARRVILVVVAIISLWMYWRWHGYCKKRSAGCGCCCDTASTGDASWSALVRPSMMWSESPFLTLTWKGGRESGIESCKGLNMSNLNRLQAIQRTYEYKPWAHKEWTTVERATCLPFLNPLVDGTHTCTLTYLLATFTHSV